MIWSGKNWYRLIGATSINSQNLPQKVLPTYRRDVLIGEYIRYSRTTGLILTRLGTKHLWVKGIQVCSTKEPILKKLGTKPP